MIGCLERGRWKPVPVSSKSLPLSTNFGTGPVNSGAPLATRSSRSRAVRTVSEQYSPACGHAARTAIRCDSRWPGACSLRSFFSGSSWIGPSFRDVLALVIPDHARRRQKTTLGPAFRRCATIFPKPTGRRIIRCRGCEMRARSRVRDGFASASTSGRSAGTGRNRKAVARYPACTLVRDYKLLAIC